MKNDKPPLVVFFCPAAAMRSHRDRSGSPLVRDSSCRRHAGVDESPQLVNNPAPDNAPVAQLDRVPGYEPGGREFESLRAHQSDQKRQASACRFFCLRDSDCTRRATTSDACTRRRCADHGTASRIGTSTPAPAIRQTLRGGGGARRLGLAYANAETPARLRRWYPPRRHRHAAPHRWSRTLAARRRRRRDWRPLPPSRRGG